MNQETSSVPSLSRLHLSSAHHFLIPELLSSWEDIITKEGGEEYIKGEHDTFHLEKLDSRWSVNALKNSLPLVGEHGADGASEDRILDYEQIVKRLIPHETEWPATKETPCFNHFSFFANLKQYQEEKRSEAEEFGKYLLCVYDLITLLICIFEC